MKEKRKIVIVGTAYPYRGGGISTFNERLATAFIDHGDEVEIFNFTLQYPSIFFPGKFQYSKEEAPKGLLIKRKVNSVNPFNWFMVGKELKNKRPDLVIFRYWIPFMAPCFGTIARQIQKNKYSKIIAITDNIIPHERKPGDKLLSTYFVKPIDAFITMSKSVMEDLKQLDQFKPKKYNPHPLYDNFGDGISKDLAKKNLNFESDTNYLLFFGFVREYKGLDLLIKAFSDKKLREYNLKLIVAGEFYTDPQPYVDLVKKLHLEDLIIMPNEFVSNSDVVNYFCAADLVVQPYKEATQSGITQIAYHFNRPMITTNVGGLSEIVIHDKVGYVVEPDENEIAKAIDKFYQFSKEDAFISNMSEIKKRFSWDYLISSFNQLFDQIKKM